MKDRPPLPSWMRWGYPSKLLPCDVCRARADTSHRSLKFRLGGGAARLDLCAEHADMDGVLEALRTPLRGFVLGYVDDAAELALQALIAELETLACG